ncbi:MAG: SDR family NAD(P)-dependent oxidoreductase [Acidimicrobiales bacterium]
MTDPGFDLTGTRALVTGASTGIGAAIATRLAEAGATVVAVSRSGRAPHTDQVMGLAADLSNPDQLDGVIDSVVDRLGGLDIVVNNAGFAEWRALAEIDRDFFDRFIDLNMWAPLRLCQLAYPHLAEGDNSSVVMIGSIDASRPSAGAITYGATKAAMAAATVAMAKEWMADGIRVNQVDPGLIDTPLASDAVAAVRADNAPINMVGRVGEPDEVAGLVHYLVSPLGRFANGTSYRVDGGALGLGPFDVR